MTQTTSETVRRSRLLLAEYAETSAELLSVLARDPISEVRLAVAENPATPHSLLELLALDEDPDVRWAMASNPQLPPGILVLLAQDDNPYVAHRASRTMSKLAAATENRVARFPDRWTQDRDRTQQLAAIGPRAALG